MIVVNSTFIITSHILLYNILSQFHSVRDKECILFLGLYCITFSFRFYFTIHYSTQRVFFYFDCRLYNRRCDNCFLINKIKNKNRLNVNIITQITQWFNIGDDLQRALLCKKKPVNNRFLFDIFVEIMFFLVLISVRKFQNRFFSVEKDI